MPHPADVALTIHSPGGGRSVRLRDYLSPAASDRARIAANRWIKALRHVSVGGCALRDRFTYRGDSLWWFAEIYLHKTQQLEAIFEAIEAVAELVRIEGPGRMSFGSPGTPGRRIVADALTRHGADLRAPSRREGHRMTRARLFSDARTYAASAVLRRLRRARPPRIDAPCDLAIFVHSAFWRGEAEEDTYLGPVLGILLQRLGPERVRFVGLGPRTNFPSRTWRQRARELRDPPPPGIVTPVEAFAPREAIRSSSAVWRARGANRRALLGAPAIRQAALLDGIDAWPVVSDLLTGVSHLQFPWSARAMDEAGAALDRLRPRIVVTYAEAGGWGRALVLEARRRAIPVVALQHGFIYRHWLNYLHEPDELAGSPDNPADNGFPLPTLTLVHDGFAAGHLMDAGRFPPEAVAVTGSARLDAVSAQAARLSAADRQAVRAQVGARPGDRVILVASKFTQIGPVFRDLLEVCGRLAHVRLVVKCHPGENPAPYERDIGGATFAAVAESTIDLGPLLAVSRLLVTVNSTAAIEAMVVGVPTLVVGLPSNLSPFVDAGVMAGADRASDLGDLVEALLYDESSRTALADRRREFLDRYGMTADGRAADRAVDAILAVMNEQHVLCGP